MAQWIVVKQAACAALQLLFLCLHKMLRSFRAVASLWEAPILLHALTSYASGNPTRKEVACMLTELVADQDPR